MRWAFCLKKQLLPDCGEKTTASPLANSHALATVKLTPAYEMPQDIRLSPLCPTVAQACFPLIHLLPPINR